VCGVTRQTPSSVLWHPKTDHQTPASAVHRQYNEDLFESTKMTFGEHLDELRRALIKAVTAFAVFVLLGILFGRPLVNYIQTPLRQALLEHYSKMELRQYRAHVEQLAAEGKVAPADIDAAVADYAKEGLFSEDRYIDERQIIDSLRSRYPKLEDPLTDGESVGDHDLVRREDLIKVRLYHDVERDPRLQLVGLGTPEPLIAWMKVGLVLGAVMSSPSVFYFIWSFIAAGLYPHEQRYVHIFLPFSVGLFLAGAGLAFFVVFKYVLGFLLWVYEAMNIDPELRLSDWLSFVLFLPLGFGISFQLPLVMLFLERIGIFSVKTYLSHWRIAVLVIAFLAMILTPAEPYSMLFMATPLIGLYFFGILLCHWMPRRTTPFGEVIA
jgi:sec-independent protein translocase protein TatC